MKKIFVTREIPESGIKLLKAKNYKVSISPHDRVLKRNELIKMAKGVDALYCLLTDKIDGELLDAIGSQLKIVANYAVGYDNIDIDACKKRGVKVSNTPGVLTNSVAEHTFSLMISVSKRIVESDSYMRKGKYKGWAPNLLLGTELKGKSLGIIGLGRIGQRVCEIASKGFGMKVIYTDLNRNTDFEAEYNAKYVTFKNLVQKSDFISIHVPLLPSTKHLIGMKELKLMKETAFLINTSRGPIVREKDLYTALSKNVIAGAGLDVFECEPKLACDQELANIAKKLDNLIVTPHTASASIEARSAMSELGARNIIACLSGKKLLTEVK